MGVGGASEMEVQREAGPTSTWQSPLVLTFWQKIPTRSQKHPKPLSIAAKSLAASGSWVVSEVLKEVPSQLLSLAEADTLGTQIFIFFIDTNIYIYATNICLLLCVYLTMCLSASLWGVAVALNWLPWRQHQSNQPLHKYHRILRKYSVGRLQSCLAQRCNTSARTRFWYTNCIFNLRDVVCLIFHSGLGKLSLWTLDQTIVVTVMSLYTLQLVTRERGKQTR